MRRIQAFFMLSMLLLASHGVTRVIGGGLSHAEPVADAFTLEQVVTLLKEQREPVVSFEEETYSSMLTRPLGVRGRLRFLPPATLEKEVLEPYRERYRIEGDQVTFESERKHLKQTISLEAYPALRSFVEAFRASMAGDAVRLKQTYETRVDGDQRSWTVRLRPHDPMSQSMIDHILLSGAEGRIATITVWGTDGDHSVMKLFRGSPP